MQVDGLDGLVKWSALISYSLPPPIDEVSSPADSLVPLLKVLQNPDINFPLFCVSSTLYYFFFLGIESKVLEASVSRP